MGCRAGIFQESPFLAAASSGEIIRMTARPALERRREEGFINMMPVTDTRLVRLRPQSASAALSVEHAEVMP